MFPVRLRFNTNFFCSIYTREPLKLNWDLIFTTVHKIHPGKVKRFCGKFQKLLKDYALSVPENLEDSIKDGFPCTCFSQPEVSRSGRKVSGRQQVKYELCCNDRFALTGKFFHLNMISRYEGRRRGRKPEYSSPQKEIEKKIADCRPCKQMCQALPDFF